MQSLAKAWRIFARAVTAACLIAVMQITDAGERGAHWPALFGASKAAAEGDPKLSSLLGVRPQSILGSTGAGGIETASDERDLQERAKFAPEFVDVWPNDMPPPPPRVREWRMSWNFRMPEQDEGAANTPAWRRYAAAAPVDDGRPRIVIVLDDLGLNRRNAWRSVALPGPLTLAVMSYAEDAERLVDGIRKAGHEVMLHLPMEPENPLEDPGPNALRVDLPDGEIDRRLAWALARFDGYVGVNNHMGSRYTADARAMRSVLREVRARDLLFLDSLTSGSSRGATLARSMGIPHARRDVFIDHELSPSAIARQLNRLEAVARARGHAIGIGHPHSMTLDMLAAWLPGLEARGFVLAPVSAVVDIPESDLAGAETEPNVASLSAAQP